MAAKLSACVFPVLIVFSYLEFQFIFAEQYDTSSLSIKTTGRKYEKLDNPIIITGIPQTIANVSLRLGQELVVPIVIDQNQYVSFGFDVTSGELNVWLSDTANVSRNEWHFDVAAVHIYNRVINPFGSSKSFSMFVHINAIAGNASFPSNTARIGAALGEQEIYKENQSSTSTTGGSTTTRTSTTAHTTMTRTSTRKSISTTDGSTTKTSTETNINILGMSFSVGGIIGTTAGGAGAISLVFVFCCCCCCGINPCRSCCASGSNPSTPTNETKILPITTLTQSSAPADNNSRLSANPLSLDISEVYKEQPFDR
jgi:hypothetical protein